MSWSFLEAAGSRGRDLNGSDCLYGECHLEHALVAVRLVAGAGRGVFALSLIEPGTELWSESPLTYAESREALVQKVDAMVCHFESLCRKRRASSKGEGIVACNFFEQGVLGAYLFKLTSLLNHACCPTASLHFEHKSFSGECRVRAIVAQRLDCGKEVCISYSATALFMPTVERRKWLHDRWGFWCRCPRCEGTLPATDLRRWALLEEAAAAADALGKPRPKTVDPAVVALQRRAAEVIGVWLPDLAEGARFTESAEYLAS